MYSFTPEMVTTWIQAWSQYRDENTNDGYSAPNPGVDGMDIYTFYLCAITYAVLTDDNIAMKALDTALLQMDKEQLQAIDKFLTEFHDYLIIMGVVEE